MHKEGEEPNIDLGGSGSGRCASLEPFTSYCWDIMLTQYYYCMSATGRHERLEAVPLRSAQVMEQQRSKQIKKWKGEGWVEVDWKKRDYQKM